MRKSFMHFERPTRACSILGLAGLILLPLLTYAANSKPANKPAPAATTVKPEDCAPSAKAESKENSVKASTSDSEQAAESEDTKAQTEDESGAMKVTLPLDEEQNIPGVSSNCEKDANGNVKCRSEKSKADPNQCEQAPPPKRDLTLPASQKVGQQE